MRLFSFLSLLILGLFLTACGGNPETSGESAAEPATSPQSELQAEVMAIHDEVMPKTGKINQLSRSLRSYLESHPDLDEAQKALLNQTVAALDQADDGMMDWMAAYGGLTRKMKEMGHEEVMKALEAEKQKISEVRDQMLSSIEAGEKLVAELAE